MEAIIILMLIINNSSSNNSNNNNNKDYLNKQVSVTISIQKKINNP